MLRRCPHRHQPAWSWLALGAVVAVLLWVCFTSLLLAYVQFSTTFDAVYGPLSAVIALLLWAQLTSIAVFLGVALVAQLEAVRGGVTQGASDDPEVKAPGMAATSPSSGSS